MNNVLSLKGKFDHIANRSRPGSPKLPLNAKVSAQKISSLINDLEKMKDYWDKIKLISDMLISAYYIKIAAKSNRIAGFFSWKGVPNDKVVGAKFGEDSKGKDRHIITYKVNETDLKQSINNAKVVQKILEEEFDGEIDFKIFNNESEINKLDFKSYEIAKTMFKKIIVDAWYVEKFDVEEVDQKDFEKANTKIVTLYDTGIDTQELLKKIGISVTNDRILGDGRTISLNEEEIKLLVNKAPYLTAMQADDLSHYSPTDFEVKDVSKKMTIQLPSNEPVVGVIDTPFDENVYFSDWVEATNIVGKDISLSSKDYDHGTAIDSIIVDGPSLNPNLDDGCGHFRVKHFGIASSGRTNSFKVTKRIEEIIAKNPEIKVWNLSLGSENEINKNFISAEGAALDRLQTEHNIIFIVSATNKSSDDSDEKKIGAPADSINSLVVGAVDKNRHQASYARKGGVLSFFIKPDISYFGGDRGDYLKVYKSDGEYETSGTSYAAAWITRKMAYLIEVIGLSREVAKALIIDSAYGWKNLPKNHNYIGTGIVPRDIKDILETPNDEIRFIVQGVSDKWDTYNYNLPIPVDKDNKYPFFARGTLCYFSKCTRAQGVDYTNTELDLYLGRINDKGRIDSINENHQSDLSDSHIREEDARGNFRKWDTVKHINQTLNPSARPKKVYKNPMWGISVKSKDRLGHNNRKNIPFGIVVTLKEMNGENRIDDFIQQLSLRGWIVSKIDIQERVNVYNQAEEEIEWE